MFPFHGLVKRAHKTGHYDYCTLLKVNASKEFFVFSTPQCKVQGNEALAWPLGNFLGLSVRVLLVRL